MGLRNARRKQAKEIREASTPDPEAQRLVDVILLGWTSFPLLLCAIIGFANLPDLIDWAKTHTQEFSARVAIAMPLAAILIGWLMYQLRERKKKTYALIELGAAAGTAYSACINVSTSNAVSTAVALSGALYIAVRGFDNLYKARIESAHKTS